MNNITYTVKVILDGLMIGLSAADQAIELEETIGKALLEKYGERLVYAEVK